MIQLPTRLFIILGLLAGTVHGQENASDSEIEFFENRIRPLLVDHCLECHGDNPDKLRGGLKLTSRAEMLAGGDSGPAVVPGHPEESLLISAVHYDAFEMPPTGKLSDQQIQWLESWVQMGAPDPRTGRSASAAAGPIDIEAGKKFWAFQPMMDPSPPDLTRLSDWPITEIDRFIAQAWEHQELDPVDQADRASLLRRVHFALTGLPPTPSQIEEFERSPRSIDEDLADVVDDLLASRRFGERWGRHWLDVARFAESSGGGRSLMFTDAWRYRDYVIESFNRDKPFDQFVLEQIAGDLLPFENQQQRSEQIVATGFLALGPTNYEQQDKELLTMEVIDEQVDTVGRGFMALTLGCARCHDHKFDPIPTSDYYALAGIFKNTRSLVDGNVSKYVERPLATDEEVAREKEYREQVEKLTKRLNAERKRLEKLGGDMPVDIRKKSVPVNQLHGIVIDDANAKLAGTWTESIHNSNFVGDHYLHDRDQPKGSNTATFEPNLATGGQYEVRLAYNAGGSRASNVPITIHHQDGVAEIVVNQSLDPPIDRLFISLGTYRFEANNVASVVVSNEGTDGYVIVDAVQFLLKSPDPGSKLAADSDHRPALSDEVAPGSLSAKESPELIQARQQVDALDRQLKELKKNAPRKVAKAMSVEDVDQPEDGHIHIRGSVRNLGDKVPRGFIQVVCSETQPDIPEDASGRLQLARWIADPEHPLTSRVYVNRVWRHLFGRGLVETTDNFGNMGQRPSHPELLDYLARRFSSEGWSTKKLVREIVLSRVFRLGTQATSSNLEIDPENRLLWRANRRRVDAEVLRDSILTVSGNLDPTAGGLTIRKITQYDLGYQFDSSRRSVYVPAFRNSMLDLFEVFDIANPNLVVGHRNTSTLPTQALFLMNSPWVHEQAESAARKLIDETKGKKQIDQLNHAYLVTLGRRPRMAEAELSLEFLNGFDLDSEDGRQAAWSGLFHSLFASLDFRYVN